MIYHVLENGMVPDLQTSIPVAKFDSRLCTLKSSLEESLTFCNGDRGMLVEYVEDRWPKKGLQAIIKLEFEFTTARMTVPTGN